jgi:hypothetical protein
MEQYNPELDNPAKSLDDQMMGLNAMIHVNHSSACPAQSLNNICPGDLPSKTRAGNNPNII